MTVSRFLSLFFIITQKCQYLVISERSGSCTRRTVADDCNSSMESFTASWIVFRDSDQGFLNVSNTPLSVGACGSAFPMWIKGRLSLKTYLTFSRYPDLFAETLVSFLNVCV